VTTTGEAGRLRLPAAFAEGVLLRTPARTLTEGDFTAIINASWESGPLHTDAEYAKGTSFGRVILGGPCLIAVAAGLTSTTMYAAWFAAGVDCTAALGIDQVRYVAPVFTGDTIHVEITVVEMHPTRGGDRYYGRVDDRVLNQHGDPVLTMSRSYLLSSL